MDEVKTKKDEAPAELKKEASNTLLSDLDQDQAMELTPTQEAEASKGPKMEKPPPKAGAPSPDADGFAAFGRFISAGWETFMETASSNSKENKSPRNFEYRKGIEGMSMGSMHYEMLTTDENSEEFKELQSEYQTGWGVPFVNLSLRRISDSIRDATSFLGIDGIWLTSVNFLETMGVQGEVFDGIPVQNKWMTIVAENMDKMGDKDEETGRRKFSSLVQNIAMGKMEKIAGTPMPVFLEGYGEQSGLYKIVIGPRSVVVVSDPVVLKHILQSSSENYSKGILSEVLEPIMGKGLIPADFNTWRQRRRAIVPGFHKQWLKETTELIGSCADVLCADIEKSLRQGDGKLTLNMEEKFTSVSLDIIGKAVFDYDFGSVNRESPVVKAVFTLMREAEHRAQSVIPYWNLPGAANVFRDQKAHEENLLLLNCVLDELIRNCIKETPQGGHVSLMQYLVMTKNEDITARQLRDDLMTLLIAGHETTAALLTWTLHELAKPEQKDILDSLLQEIDTVLGGRQVTFDDFTNLPVMKSCLLETLRLYPAPPILIRRCENGDEVPVGPTCNSGSDTVSFLPGQDIFISTWSLHRSEQLWGEDAAEYKPSRWDKEIKGQGKWNGFNPKKAGLYPGEVASDFAFVPFGGGSRKCIGDYFALLEAEVILTSILQRFSFSANEKMPEGGPNMQTGATIHTAEGLLMDVKKREGRSAVKAQPAPQDSEKEAPFMEKKTSKSIAQRIEGSELVVPTAAELRMLFTAQAEAKLEMGLDNQEALEKAYEQCKEVTREHSKTFFLGSQLLAPDEQRVVWAIYNWCRSTDELVDGPEAENTTTEDLVAWEEKLNQTFTQSESLSEDDWEELALADSVQRFGLIQRPFQDMIGGMAMDLVKERYKNFQELEVYCYRVAGTVGLMTLPVLGFDGLQNFTEELQEETIASAMSLGVAFQLTNILRDVGEDARRGRIYLPQEDFERFGITEEEVIEAANTQGKLFNETRWVDFMEFQFERCNRYYDEAEGGIVGLSEVNRLGVMAALYVYQGILERIRENKYDNFSRRAYVPLTEKVWHMGRAWWRVRELQEVAEENIRTGRIFERARQKA